MFNFSTLHPPGAWFKTLNQYVIVLKVTAFLYSHLKCTLFGNEPKMLICYFKERHITFQMILSLMHILWFFQQQHIFCDIVARLTGGMKNALSLF